MIIYQILKKNKELSDENLKTKRKSEENPKKIRRKNFKLKMDLQPEDRDKKFLEKY
jgi:hypothetical protein